MNKPKQSFHIGLSDTSLDITGQDYPNLPTATMEVRTGGINKTEITIPVGEAKRIVRKHLEHHPNPMKHQTDEAKEIAHAWAKEE